MKRLLAIVLLISTSVLVFGQKTAAEYKAEGQEAYKAKDYLAAYTAFNSAILENAKNNTVDTLLYYNTGYCAYKSKKYAEAAELFQKSIEVKYKREKAQVFLINCHKKADNNEMFVASLMEGYEQYPRNKKIKKFMAGHQFKEGIKLYNEASELIQKAAAVLESDEAKFKELKAQAETKYKEALPYLEKAFELDPKTQNLPQALKGVYEGLGMKEKVAEMEAIIGAE